METSAEILFKKNMVIYRNVQSLLRGFAQASTTNLQSITVPIEDIETGVITNQQINSFQNVLNQLTRLDNNFISLTNEENIATIINSDGSVGQIMKTSFSNAQYLENFKFGKDPASASITDLNAECIVDVDSFIKRMVYPMVKLPIVIDSKLKSSVNVTVYNITSGFDDVPVDTTLINLDYLISTGIVDGTKEQLTLQQEKERVKFFGKFSVSNVTVDGNNSTFTVNNTKYSGINFASANIDLRVNDILVTKDGMSKHRISSIDLFTGIVNTVRVGGSTNVENGVDSLFYNEILPTDKNIIGLPVAPNQKLIVFLSTENSVVIGYPSVGIKLDTSTYTVVYENETFTIDEFYSREVMNFTDYLTSIIRESNIPYSLGVTPPKIVLESANFNVVQINRHLTSAKSASEIEAMNKQKQEVINQLSFNKTQIDRIQGEIDTGKYKSDTEKAYRLNRVTELRSERNVLDTNLFKITSELDTQSINNGLKSSKPKYAILGSWGIPADLYSPSTKPQKIIKFDVQYRYLSKNIDTVENTSSKLIVDGVQTSITYSSWNPLETRSLRKVADNNGNLVWETPILDSADDININELSIAINSGESVEIRVRAVSEAGYPTSTKYGEFSEVLRVDFPSNLVESNISTIIAKNEIDLRQSEFQNILKQSGILEHIEGVIRENERTFWHNTNQIASGFFTAENKIIPLFGYLQTIVNRVSLLESAGSIKNVIIELVDFTGEKFTIENNSTMSINAGSYNETVNLLDNTKYGSIIRKQGFIKIRNNNDVPIDVKSLVPGVVFDSNNAQMYYNVPVKRQDALIQTSKQILYFRNIDITLQSDEIFKLVVPKEAPTTNTINPLYLDEDAIITDRNIIHYDGTNVRQVKLLPNSGTDFLAYTKEHPNFNADEPNNFLPALQLAGKTFTPNTKRVQVSEETTPSSIDGVGFLDNDLYAVGENSVGAFLYPIIANQNAVSVIGDSSVAVMVVTPNTEISIPFVFEYRMTDRLGKVNGINGTTITDEIRYTKKMGVDMLLNNQRFSFDIECFANLKSKVASLESLNISSVVGEFRNEEPETLS